MGTQSVSFSRARNDIVSLEIFGRRSSLVVLYTLQVFIYPYTIVDRGILTQISYIQYLVYLYGNSPENYAVANFNICIKRYLFAAHETRFCNIRDYFFVFSCFCVIFLVNPRGRENISSVS